jgi:hypothetical protein
MGAHESPIPETRTGIASRPARALLFTKLFAAIGFVVGGSVVLYLGFRTPSRPPMPPGFVACGHSAVGEWVHRVITAFLLAPLVAGASAMGAALLGGLVDLILPTRPEGWRQRKATTDALLRLLDDPAPGVRKNALDALEIMAPRDVLESALAKMLNDADERNRDAAKQVQEDLRKREN